MINYHLFTDTEGNSEFSVPEAVVKLGKDENWTCFVIYCS